MHHDIRAQERAGSASTGDMNVLSTLTSTPCAWAIGAHRGNVRQRHDRIGRRLDVNQLRRRLDRRFNSRQVARIDILDLDAVVRTTWLNSRCVPP
jgi:hypothetical protein